jgi:hypothetical protein
MEDCRKILVSGSRDGTIRCWPLKEMQDPSASRRRWGAALSEQGLDKRGLFREGALRTLLEQHYAGRRTDAGRLWALLMLEKWFQRYEPGFSV